MSSSRKPRKVSEGQWYSPRENASTTTFQKLQSQIADIGLEFHRETLLQNAKRNAPHIGQTIRDIQPDSRACLVISAGPSLQREGILKRIKDFKGTIVAADGAYIQCLKAGIKPDWVVTLDPSPRIARWFGQRVDDEYFKRQDLDIAIREEQENVELINANKIPLVICSTTSEDVVQCTEEFTRYWFSPLVDDPFGETSLTKEIVEITKCPALSSGGTVGTAAIVFALQILHNRDARAQGVIACVGMDFGYYDGTPLEQTQEYNLLKHHFNIYDYYPYINGHWGACFTSPTYYYYLQNFLDLLKNNDAHVTNCSGGGILLGNNVICCELEQWLKSCS